MSATTSTHAPAGFGIAEGYGLIQRAAFDAASRVIRYHATAAELKLARRQAALEDAARQVASSGPAAVQA